MPLYLSILYYWFGLPHQSVDRSASKSIVEDWIFGENEYLEMNEMNTRKKPVASSDS